MQQDQEFPYFTANLDTVDTNSCNGMILLKVRAQIVLFNQEPQSVLVLMDGGSSHSFISPTVLTQAQFRAAGSKNSNLFTRKNFQINGATGEHEFLISGSVTKHDMIIGRDFFKLHKVKIDHESEAVIIDGIQIDINPIHTIGSKFFKQEENEFLDTS
jgi:hypothetical protein